MARFLLVRLDSIIKQAHKTVVQFFDSGYPGYPSLALDVCPSFERSDSDIRTQPGSLLDGLFDGFLWGACPKHRRSRERRATRQFGSTKIRAFMTPKRNIVECLDCGHWHEAHTICGNCYQKVKEETQAMQAKMDPEVRLYSTPRTEVVYVYKGEEDSKNMFEGKYIVEMDKPRPEWFPKNLLTKGHGKY